MGGELLTVPKVNSESGVPMGATTDVHYNVPALIFETGEAVLCAIIFKSDPATNKIQSAGRLGLILQQTSKMR